MKKAAVVSICLRAEVMEAYRELAKLKGITLSKVVEETLDEYFELDQVQCEIEIELEAQTGVRIPMTGLPMPDAAKAN